MLISVTKGSVKPGKNQLLSQVVKSIVSDISTLFLRSERLHSNFHSVHGLPPDTPSWLPLYDVTYGEESVQWPLSRYTGYQALSSCSDMFFDLTDESVVEGTLGSATIWYGSDFVTVNRTSVYHAPLFDLRKVRSCLESDREYLITARVRLESTMGELTSCALSNTHCLELDYDYMDSSERRRTTRLWMETPSRQLMYGKTFTVSIRHIFPEEDVAATNIFQALRFYGADPEVDIYVEDISIGIPPPAAFYNPTNVCKDLVPGNGDAEVAGWSTFPFESTRNWIDLNVEEDVCGNHFFQIRGRSYQDLLDPNGVPSFAGITWRVPLECVRENSLLRFGANIRPQQAFIDQGPMNISVRLRGESLEGAEEVSLAECNGIAGDDWFPCTGLVAIPPELVSSGTTEYWVRIYADPSAADYDIDDISLRVQSGSPSGLVVDEAVLGKWGVGSDLLITSHTPDWDAQQTRKIISIEKYALPGLAVIQLDSSFSRPTTLLDSKDFAVEIGLLSRNIIFEASEDSVSNHGGHFWVKHTPSVVQIIEGLEIRNFGQQGSLGRYPLHFHLCGDVAGSIVSKNVVRHSNQRCFVVHGTNSLLVQDNVAYDTKGHCFIVEDGVETGNKFVRNLGAKTDTVDRLIPNETDDRPSTFWITNPTNEWIGNVAAGSFFAGYWIEPILRGPRAYLFEGQDPRTQPLGRFHGNKAHSNGDDGFRSYPTGYIPRQEAVFTELVSFRNRRDGVFFHNSINLALVDSILADNQKQIDIDRAENVRVENTLIVGQSELFRSLIEKQGIESNCRSDGIIGIDLHTFSRFAGDNGPHLRNINFQDFHDTDCWRSFPFSYDNEKRLGLFDAFASVGGLTFEEQRDIMDFCKAKDAGIVGVYISDVDGSLDPNQTGRPGTAMIDTPDMLFFVDESMCTHNPENCYSYCETCLRSIRYEIDQAETSDMLLRVCNSSQNCIDLPGFVETEYGERISTETRVYNAHLPPGSYTAEFVDSRGHGVWPTFVLEKYEEKMCPMALEEGSVELLMPELESGECTDLIRNGGGEMSLTKPLHWLHRSGGVKLLVNQGRSGNAIGNAEYERDRDGIVQYVDVRCLEGLIGRWFEVEAWVKTEQMDGRSIPCGTDNDSCSQAIVSGLSWGYTVAKAIASTDSSGYQLMHGTVQVTEEIVQSPLVEFVMTTNEPGIQFLFDDISMTLLPNERSSCPTNLVYNGDFADGDARFWEHQSGTNSIVSLSGSTTKALRMNRGDSRGRVRPHCFIPNERYEFSMKFRMSDQRGRLIECGDPGLPDCPRAQLFGWKLGERTATENAGYVRGIGDWKEIYGVFVATPDLVQADNLAINIRDVVKNAVLDVTDVSISHVPQDCSDIVINSDMEDGYRSFWGVFGDGVMTNFSPGRDSSTAVKYSGRTHPRHGPQYNLDVYGDLRCFVPGATVEVSTWVQIVMAGTDILGSCDTAMGDCPSIYFRVRDSSGSVVFAQSQSMYALPWDSSNFNELKVRFTLPDWDGSISSVTVVIRDFDPSYDVIFDDFTMKLV